MLNVNPLKINNNLTLLLFFGYRPEENRYGNVKRIHAKPIRKRQGTETFLAEQEKGAVPCFCV